MSRRKKLTYLTQPEIDWFMKAATELHSACCDPIISPSCDHSPRADRTECGNRHGD
jgi:hypothetical protein